MPPPLSPWDLATVLWKPSHCFSLLRDKGHALHLSVWASNKLTPLSQPARFSSSGGHSPMLYIHLSPRGHLERGWGKLVVAMSRVVQGASGGRFRTLNVLGIGDSQEQHSKLQSGEIQWVIPAKLKNTLLSSTVKSMYYLNYQLLNSTNTWWVPLPCNPAKF